MTKNKESSKIAIERFIRRFDKNGSSYQKFISYAALPLFLTPELLNYFVNTSFHVD